MAHQFSEIGESSANFGPSPAARGRASASPLVGRGKEPQSDRLLTCRRRSLRGSLYLPRPFGCCSPSLSPGCMGRCSIGG